MTTLFGNAGLRYLALWFGGWLSIATAHAASYTIDGLSFDTLNGFSRTVSRGAFVDQHYFPLSDAVAEVRQAVEDNVIAFGGAVYYDIDNLTLTLFQEDAGGWTELASGLAGETLALTPAGLPGQFRLDIAGEGVGSVGGYYTLGIELAAVPVPAAAWLLLSGLFGLYGLSRRPAAIPG